MTIFDCALPEDWKREPVAANYRVTKKSRAIALTPEVPLPFVAMEKVPAGGQMECGFELRTPDAIASGTYFEVGDILLAKITPSFENGKQGLVNGLPGAFGYGSTELIPLQACTDKAINPYLFYLLLHHEVRDSLTSKMEGSTGRKRVPEGSVRELEIPVPPKAEQQKIAAVLWKMQRAIATQDRLITTTRDLKQSAMQHLFAHGLRGESLKDTAIGQMPESWKPTTIGDIASVGSGGTPSRTHPTYWLDGTIPWVKTGEVDYYVINDTEEKITQEGLRNSAAKIYSKGTLLMAMYGQGVTRGKVAILGIDASINQACAAIQTHDDRAHPDFLYYVLTHNYEQLRGLAHGGQQQNLNADLIRGFSFGLPTNLDEQRDIAAALATIDRKLAHHQKKRAALNDLFQTTLHQLMTAQVRVADLDIDTSEIANHVPDVRNMVDRGAGDHIADASKMVGTRRKRAVPDHFVDADKMIRGKSRGRHR
ncbi:restriction endonuclease subunit S [Rhodanobacter soli]